MINKKYRNLYYMLIIAVALISYIPLIVIGIYDRPSADDFNYSITTFSVWNETYSIAALLKSAIQTSVRFWNKWQGLYSSAFLLSLQPAIFGTKYYALTGILMIFLIAGSTVFFANYIMKRLFNRTLLESTTIGLMMSFLMVQYMPSCIEGLYWFNGAVNYGFFYAVLLIFICLLIELQRTNSMGKEVSIFILSLLVVFVLEGGNHVTALMGTVSTAVIAVVFCRRNKRKTIENIALFMTSMGFLALNLSSPGTTARAVALGDETIGKMNVFWAAFRAMWESIRNIGDWFGFKEVVLLILVLPILIELTQYIRKTYDFRFQYPLVVIIVSVAWLSIMYCPPFYALGGCGADRLINIVYYCYVILLFVDMTYLIGWLQNIIPEEYLFKLSVSNKMFLSTIVILSFALFLSSVLDTWAFEAVNELYNREAQIYAEEFDEREMLIFNSKEKEIKVSEFSVKPQILFFDDITNNKNDWRNKGVSDYYGLESIVLK